MNTMQNEVRALVERHCVTLRSELAEVDVSLEGLETKDVPTLMPLLFAGIERVHKIKGSSGSIGFTEISASAAQLEKNLREAYAQEGPDAALSQTIASDLARLHELVNNVQPEQSRLWNTDFSALSS